MERGKEDRPQTLPQKEKGGVRMKLKHFSFAIMIVNMLTMFGLLFFTFGIATNMNTITEALLDPYYEARPHTQE